MGILLYKYQIDCWIAAVKRAKCVGVLLYREHICCGIASVKEQYVCYCCLSVRRFVWDCCCKVSKLSVALLL